MNKKIWIIIGLVAGLTTLFAIVANVNEIDEVTGGNSSPSAVESDEPASSVEPVKPVKPIDPVETQPESLPMQSLPVLNQDGTFFFSIEALISQLNGRLSFDEVNGTIQFEVLGQSFEIIRGIPVVFRNGIALPKKFSFVYKENENEWFFPTSFLSDALQLDIREIKEGEIYYIKPSKPAFGSTDQTKPNIALENMTSEELIRYLSFLSIPIENAKLSTRDSQLPAAPRTYRNGIHEGIDWYSGVTGIQIDDRTPVLSMADGVVVRADLDYQELTYQEREDLLKQSKQSVSTPLYILDKLRGRSVWVQYENGVLVRYIHLSRIEDGIEVGKRVARGERLGYVGNSGTSNGVEGSREGFHLQTDILIYGELFWKYLDYKEIRSVLSRLFT
ncbi:M23 family metallopeptidase [Microaerobacter geothermalis]|uniref:M23 family metallopeptidase n=1 Tax=Microaerobacter geothermalis TaxID=674972 RepID=UPI001F1AF73F|nr:M23 family metallopeptidase [Microaerobacter geothermalis]MCF6093683.1 M23 family metallopeptidase [Microaerobacter geothermalis]